MEVLNLDGIAVPPRWLSNPANLLAAYVPEVFFFCKTMHREFLQIRNPHQSTNTVQMRTTIEQRDEPPVGECLPAAPRLA
jgi:hypothetical protein